MEIEAHIQISVVLTINQICSDIIIAHSYNPIQILTFPAEPLMPTSDHVEIVSDQVGDIAREASRHVLCDTDDYQLIIISIRNETR